jgi:hypothetical protein
MALDLIELGNTRSRTHLEGLIEGPDVYMVLEFYSGPATNSTSRRYSSRSLVWIADKLLQWTITGYRNTSYTVSNLQNTACWAQFLPKILTKDIAYLWFIERHFVKIYSPVLEPTHSSGTENENDELKLVLKKTVTNCVSKFHILCRTSTQFFIQNNQYTELKMESNT